MASQRPGAHPGHRNRMPMALELIQAIGIACRWLWSSSRPSGSHPDGLEMLQSHPDGLEMLQSHPDGLEMLQSHPDGLEMLQSHPNGLELIQAIRKPSRCPGGATVRALWKN
ncbi:hypothetical protein PSTG_09026 [Puccinia striiformis f. sp. tritici PST-78]|uniref:Uncharacterized protein n=1 Tax=Puccinia striiformis f. sp. tritici PST-78 TaxID=1165861 RepID=A0A0L0VFM3_9BASI|nr:hypothetical protein PSTG_09026 [Puccinia striiformis f. sp. tritici PST-78]